MAVPVYGVQQGTHHFERGPVAATRFQHGLPQLRSAACLSSAGFLFLRVRAPQRFEEGLGLALCGPLGSPVKLLVMHEIAH
ncbi:MAG: hypothetical protein BGP24_19965 [Lysobacterales bacterium 69-70]|nr:MAG: hypothetical protein ABT27_17320 [Xanthomonadaceae bacterium SCN 69-25]OJY97249.1 MAG: hypothetical protein BGP24_19965 [Xanthomonadales bacterium 69-70]